MAINTYFQDVLNDATIRNQFLKNVLFKKPGHQKFKKLNDLI